MGAVDFRVIGKGKTAREAFGLLVQEARYREGNGGYTGTIAEKDSFLMVPARAEDVIALTARAKSASSAAENPAHRRHIDEQVIQLSTARTAHERAEGIAEVLMAINDPRINDKYGPAGCIALPGDEFLFFGWASE